MFVSSPVWVNRIRPVALLLGSKKSRWSMSSSDSVRRHPGAVSATSSTVQRAESLSNSDVDSDCRICLRIAIIVTPILGLCVLIPIVVVALRLLSGSGRRQARRPLIVLPATQEQKTDRSDTCSLCGDPALLCLCHAADNSSKIKFVVLTADQLRRSPGGGYQQIVQPLSTTVYPCRCCERNSHPAHDATDRTAFRLDADVDGDFV